MKFTVRPGLQLSLVLILILAAYFQTIYHPFSRFDDPFILEHYGANSTLTWSDVITPGRGFYYRPIVSLSYWLDFKLWGLDSTFMHLENIIVHLLNVILVFLIASRLAITSGIKNLPILSALLFGLHPINSESVNWIAGRTDVYAGLFVFIAVYCLIRAVQEQSTRFAILAFGVAFVGVLAKETAIMFIPAALLVTTYWPVVSQNVLIYKAWRTRFLLIPIVISSCLVSLLLLLVYVKGRGNNAISMALEGGTNVLVRLFEAFGFYVKKIFMPLPLNVAIVEVASVYAIVGIVTIIVVVITLRRSVIPGIFFASAVLFILPALIVATIPVAWTPFGERYLYIPSAFAAIASLEFFYRLFERWNVAYLFVPIFIFIIAIASIVTVQRGMLWGDNLALINDIVDKSPNFGVARNEYGALLVQEGLYEEAEQQFKIALQQNNQESVNRIIRLNLIGIKINGKHPVEARKILLSEIGKKVDGDVVLLKHIYKCEESILGGTTLLEDEKKIVADMIETNESLYHKTNDPHYLYLSGQLALSIGNNQQAAVFFKKTYENASPNAYYRESARKLSEKLAAK